MVQPKSVEKRISQGRETQKKTTGCLRVGALEGRQIHGVKDKSNHDSYRDKHGQRKIVEAGRARGNVRIKAENGKENIRKREQQGMRS